MLGNYSAFADLRNYLSAAAMIDDVQAILYAVRDVIATPDFNTTQIIVDFLNNTSVEAIDYDHETIHALIETVFELNYLSDFEGVMYDTLVSKDLIKGTSTQARRLARETSTLSKTDFMFELSLASDATEFADLRTSQFFPAEAYIGGVNLPEGKYLVQVKYLDKHGRKLYEEVFENVEVAKNKLNLLETLCVK